jgi:hypothetical protein
MDREKCVIKYLVAPLVTVDIMKIYIHEIKVL